MVLVAVGSKLVQYGEQSWTSSRHVAGCFFSWAEVPPTLDSCFRWTPLARHCCHTGTNTIISDPDVMMGKPVVAGTRITVELILEELGHGQPIDNLVSSYPALTYEGVLAALEYAAKVLRLECGADPDGSLLVGLAFLADENVETEIVQLGPRSPVRPASAAQVP